MKITRSTEVRRSEWRLAAMLMHVPNVRLLDTGLDEAKWKIGLAWRKADPLNPLIHNFIRLVRQPRSVAPTGALKSSR